LSKSCAKQIAAISRKIRAIEKIENVADKSHPPALAKIKYAAQAQIVRQETVSEVKLRRQNYRWNGSALGVLFASVVLVEQSHKPAKVIFSQAAVELVHFGAGQQVTFVSGTTDLVPRDTNGALDVFVRDTCIRAVSGCAPSTVRVSVALDGTQGNKDSFKPVISADGRFVVFISAAKLGPGSPNSLGGDVYLARH